MRIHLRSRVSGDVMMMMAMRESLRSRSIRMLVSRP